MPPSGKRRGKYLGFVAHEIKNPLATALWSCDLLRRMQGDDRTGERADKMIDVSLRALRRMRRLIEDYFAIERLQEHGYELKRDRVQLKELVESAMRTLSEKDGIYVEGWSIDVGDAECVGDPEMLKRCVRYVLEHMARGSVKANLAVVAHGGEGQATLQFRAEVPPSPLSPPEPEERPSGDPTGAVLGFALAQQIVAAHNGTLEERDGGLALTISSS